MSPNFFTMADVLAMVPQMHAWGRDHWSTFLYLETRIVDHHGMIKDAQMRGRDPEYPTRLNDGTEIQMHSDWDCIDDMAAAGLVRFVHDEADGTMRYQLTDYGWIVAGALRKHRAITGSTSHFEIPEKP